MEEMFDLIYNQGVCGTVSRRREGLYDYYRCRCTLPDSRVYYIAAKSKECDIRLGICVPADNGYVLETKIPAKKLPYSEICFYLLPKEGICEEEFIQISCDRPFAYIHLLHNAHMKVKDGQQGVILNMLR